MKAKFSIQTEDLNFDLKRLSALMGKEKGGEAIANFCLSIKNGYAKVYTVSKNHARSKIECYSAINVEGEATVSVNLKSLKTAICKPQKNSWVHFEIDEDVEGREGVISIHYDNVSTSIDCTLVSEFDQRRVDELKDYSLPNLFDFHACNGHAFHSFFAKAALMVDHDCYVNGLQGVHVARRGSNFVVEASNAVILYQQKSYIEDRFRKLGNECIIPIYEVLRLLKIVDKSLDDVYMDFSPKEATFIYRGITYIFPLLVDKFPHCDSYIPKNLEEYYLVGADKLAFANALKRMLPHAPKPRHEVRLTFEESAIKMSTIVDDCSKITETISADCAYAPDLTTSFNCKLLMRALSGIPEHIGRVNLRINSPDRPCVIDYADTFEDCTILIMPIALKP
jgi:DNA polymerase III sliding clamp (beta) subunit (PCNA family)